LGDQAVQAMVVHRFGPAQSKKGFWDEPVNNERNAR
jgi:hypothetical protein